MGSKLHSQRNDATEENIFRLVLQICGFQKREREREFKYNSYFLPFGKRNY